MHNWHWNLLNILCQSAAVAFFLGCVDSDGIGRVAPPETPEDCKANELFCDSKCVPSNENNCGTCGNLCKGGSFCLDGACVCKDNQLFCSGKCIDIASDTKNCGGCNVLCEDLPNTEHSTCSEKQCHLTCQDGFADCNGAIEDGCETNTHENINHCGSCSIVCSHGCVKGNCKGCPEGFVEVKAGSFHMGSDANGFGHAENEALHEVRLTKDFCIQSKEVSLDYYNSVIPNSNLSGAAQKPVAVSWFEAALFANKLSEQKGLTPCYACELTDDGYKCAYRTDISIYDCKAYRLPTEAEWEFAARAGTQTTLYNGDCSELESCNQLASDIGWFKTNADSQPHESAIKTPNNLGIFDMIGNMAEWCHDIYVKDYNTMTENPVFESNSESEPSPRILRGGSYFSEIHQATCAARQYNNPQNRTQFSGFRLALTSQHSE